MDKKALEQCINKLELSIQFLVDAEFSCFEKEGMAPVKEGVTELKRFSGDLLRHLKDLQS